MKTFNEKTYRPLPEQLTIKPSNIDGLGLHTNEYLDAGTVLGETHVLAVSYTHLTLPTIGCG